MESALFRGLGGPDVQLIETLGWDGAALIRLDRHMARLADAARALGYPCDLAKARAALGQAAQRTDGPARLRLTLDMAGAVQVAVAAMPAQRPMWRVGLARQVLRSDDPYLRIKSSHRPAYDAARDQLPQDLDEVILLNERGEVADGSITTVFYDRGQGLRTPPLTSGALPGVLRGEIAAREEVLLPKDLPGLRLWVGNSLRGLIAAQWVPAQP